MAKQEEITSRLEYLRQQIRKETISTDEILELESLKEFLEPEDVELLEWVCDEQFN